MHAAADSIRYGGRRLAGADASFEWSPSGGRFEGFALGIGRQRLHLAGTFERGDQPGEPVGVRLDRFQLTTRDGTST